jgi:hypothetical protein
VTYTNDLAAPLHVLCFVVEPNRFLDAFHLQHVRKGDGSPLGSYRLEGARLWVPLPQPLMGGQTTTLELAYRLDVPEQRGAFGSTGRQINLTDWYPHLPPRNDDGSWVLHEPAAVGEHLPYPTADFQVGLHLVETSQAWQFAVPSPAGETGEPLAFELQSARDLALSVSPDFIKLESAEGGFTLSAYVFPEHLSAGRHALDVALQSLQLYSKLFGPPPQKHLTIVEADFFDGRECSGLFFLDQAYFEAYTGRPAAWLTTLTAHETSHQWWFNKVGNDPALEPWLDEALATYSERLYYEHEHPDYVLWWWGFRVGSFNPTGDVDSAIYDHDGFRDYVDAVYLRGASMMEALRTHVGETTFLTFLGDYAARGASRINSGEDFFNLLAAYSDVELDPVLSPFFKHPLPLQ